MNGTELDTMVDATCTVELIDQVSSIQSATTGKNVTEIVIEDIDFTEGAQFQGRP